MRYLTLTVLLFVAPLQLSAQKRLPIIDMHLHANSFDVGKGASICTNDQKLVFRGWDPKEPLVFEKLMGCPTPLQSASTNEAVMRESLALLERYNIWAVTSGPLERVKAWRAASPKRIMPAVPFGSHSYTPAALRRLVAEGTVTVFAEISAQYRGFSLADQSFDAYFALAEELDIPVGVHLGEGPPGGAHGIPCKR